MNIRFVPAKACPDTMPELDSYKKNPQLNCCIILQPNKQTELAVQTLIQEYGAKSESYYQSRPSNRPSARGTGKGDVVITSYVMPYLQKIHSGNTIGIFYLNDIQAFIEPVMTQLFENSNDNIRCMPANECPHSAIEIVKHTKTSDVFCCIIKNPTANTDQVMADLIKEYGSKSESYYKSRGIYRPRESGTGKGEITITSYIMPYTEFLTNGHIIGLFYNKDIQSLIEPILARSFNNTQDHRLTLKSK